MDHGTSMFVISAGATVIALGSAIFGAWYKGEADSYKYMYERSIEREASLVRKQAQFEAMQKKLARIVAAVNGTDGEESE